MNADKLLSIGSSIVMVALVTTIVIHPESSKVIGAVGNAFASSLRAAIGK